MAFENYLMAETNCYTRENGGEFTCSEKEGFEFIPADYIADDDDRLETRIEKVTGAGEGAFKYDFVLENLGIEEDEDEEEDRESDEESDADAGDCADGDCDGAEEGACDAGDDGFPEGEKYHHFSLTLKKGDRLEIQKAMCGDNEYGHYVSLLIEITEACAEKISYKVAGILEDDAEEEDYSYVPVECLTGEKLGLLPHEAVFSMDVTLKSIEKDAGGDGFKVTFFVEADDSDEDEDQTLSYVLKKGDRMEFDDYDLWMCCVRPDRIPVEMEVTDISEKGITLKKLREL